MISDESAIFFYGGGDGLDWMMIKERVELLHEEFNIPIWVTEFDWNGDESVEFGDHTRHAEILEDFYRLMFSLEVIQVSPSDVVLCHLGVFEGS